MIWISNIKIRRNMKYAIYCVFYTVRQKPWGSANDILFCSSYPQALQVYCDNTRTILGCFEEKNYFIIDTSVRHIDILSKLNAEEIPFRQNIWWDTGHNLGRQSSKQFIDLQMVGTNIRFHENRKTEKPTKKHIKNNMRFIFRTKKQASCGMQ